MSHQAPQTLPAMLSDIHSPNIALIASDTQLSSSAPLTISSGGICNYLIPGEGAL